MAVRRGTPHPVVDDETWPDGARPDRRVHVFVWVGLLLVGLMLSSEAPGQVFRAGIPVPAPSGPPVAPLPTDAPASPTVADDPVPSSLYT